MSRRHPVGLCVACAHVRITGNRRGSRFYMCERAKKDPAFPKYPPLPVVACPGFEEAGPDPWADHEDADGDR